MIMRTTLSWLAISYLSLADRMKAIWSGSSSISKVSLIPPSTYLLHLDFAMRACHRHANITHPARLGTIQQISTTPQSKNPAKSYAQNLPLAQALSSATPVRL